MSANFHITAPPRISFCSTCSNRVGQLEKVYWHNAKKIQENPYAEWIILNYGSRDNLDQFMHSVLRSSCNRIIYATDNTKPEQWHASKAKNIAHFAASGEILFNLDCDNFIGDACEIVAKFFDYGCMILHMTSGVGRDGTYGRIAIDKNLFCLLGGYDESFYPMGYQDTDLLIRAYSAGHHVMHCRSRSQYAVANTKIESIRHCKIGELTWEDFDQLNHEISHENVVKRRFRVNTDKSYHQLNLKIIRGTLI